MPVSAGSKLEPDAGNVVGVTSPLFHAFRVLSLQVLLCRVLPGGRARSLCGAGLLCRALGKCFGGIECLRVES